MEKKTMEESSMGSIYISGMCSVQKKKIKSWVLQKKVQISNLNSNRGMEG